MPSDAEWFIMENFVDPTITDPGATGGRGTDGGTKLKATTGWGANNGTNAFGFFALPAGYIYTGTFYSLGDRAYWWTSTDENSTDAWRRTIGYPNTYMLTRLTYTKNSGFSVRCIKD